MKKSSPQQFRNPSNRFARVTRRLIATSITKPMYRRSFFLLSLFFFVSCGAGTGLRTHLEPRDPGDCRALDSLFAASGWREPVAMRGKLTLDVKQYRVRGRFELSATAQGDLTLEITSTTALGGHREDLVLSFYDDTLRVLDRERGQYYEGEEVDGLVSDGVGVEWDLAGVLRQVTVRAARCDRFESVSSSPRSHGCEVKGKFDGEDFSLDFAEGRIQEANWPAVLGGRPDDHLRITYGWEPAAEGGARLDELVIFLEERRWRAKLISD